MIYGWNAINEFLQETNCTLIMRAHEATAGGVKICKHAKVITVFSTSKGRGSFLFAALPFQSFIVEIVVFSSTVVFHY